MTRQGAKPEYAPPLAATGTMRGVRMGQCSELVPIAEPIFPTFVDSVNLRRRARPFGCCLPWGVSRSYVDIVSCTGLPRGPMQRRPSRP